jgi:hypothetical protein
MTFCHKNSHEDTSLRRVSHSKSSLGNHPSTWKQKDILKTPGGSSSDFRTCGCCFTCLRADHLPSHSHANSAGMVVIVASPLPQKCPQARCWRHTCVLLDGPLYGPCLQTWPQVDTAVDASYRDPPRYKIRHHIILGHHTPYPHITTAATRPQSAPHQHPL